MAVTMAPIQLYHIGLPSTALANNIMKRKNTLPNCNFLSTAPRHQSSMTFFDLTSEAAKQAPNSPVAKRQKTNGGFDGGAEYNSSDDSDPFEGLGMPTKHLTQPTQIICGETPQLPSSPKFDAKKEEVLVPASSPFRQQSMVDSANGNGTKRDHNGNNITVPIAARIAPPGTSFRPPAGVQKAPVPPKVIDLEEDDGPSYQGGSSDDEIEEISADIVPSVFKSGGSKISMASGGSGPSFKNLMGTFKAPPLSTTSQARPAKAMPVGAGTSLKELTDPIERRKVERILAVCPGGTKVDTILDALRRSNGFLNDAQALVLREIDERRGKVTITDDRNGPPLMAARGIPAPKGIAQKPIFHQPPPQPMAPQMKKQVKAPVASIAERYSGTQKKAAVIPFVVDETTPPKPKRKLMQGRRNPDPDSPLKAKSATPEAKKRSARPIEEIEEIHGGALSDGGDYDSDMASEEEVDQDLEDRVLRYLNKCELKDLVELVNVKESTVEFFLSQRPFKTLEFARDVTDAKDSKTGRKSTKIPLGDKIVQNACDMMSGYEAVDDLVKLCSELGKPLNEEMASWGFNVNGAKQAGELEMTSLEEEPHDSGISGVGTPTSKGSEAGDDEIKAAVKRKTKFLGKPGIMSNEVTLKDYQLVGLNWLSLLYKHKLSCILADDMGLGKTCQVIAFLSHLIETGHQGPHLIIVPPSTLENWLREFERFSPGVVVEPYYGSQGERAEIAERILDQRDEVNVVISTYDFAAKKDDNKFMRKLRPDVCVYDEGHLLKNPQTQKYQGLIKIGGKFRLLLTGTPLQNNLRELTGLLAFILPDIFKEKQEDLNFVFKHKASTRDADHAALLSAQRIERAKSMLTPFILRRKKAQVLKHMPAKICKVEYCDMMPEQAKVYHGLKGRAIERAKLKAAGEKIPDDKENNPLMQLRKAAIHPMLFRRYYDDETVLKMCKLLRKYESHEFNQREDQIFAEMKLLNDFQLHTWCMQNACIAQFDVPDLAWMDSGKVKALERLLKKYKENGDRVLIFSQFVVVLDILEAVFQTANIHFTRIDGSTKVNERQTIIDEFKEDESITAFLLSTGAGGTGINLMYANKVIIFDGSFNPQDDIQAENRAHRVGQTREVEVVRLVTKGTIEEQIYKLGQSKLELDSKVAGDDDKAKASLGEKMVAEMLLEDEGKEEKAEDKSGDNKVEAKA